MSPMPEGGEAVKEPTSVTIYRKDYQPPPYWIRNVDLFVNIASKTSATVKAVLSMEPRLEGEKLILNGDSEMQILSIKIKNAEGGAEKVLSEGEYVIKEKPFVPASDPERLMEINYIEGLMNANFILETELIINPEANQSCSGLYASGNLLCTQMEAEGMRKFTYFLDRPDVMSKYRCTIEADKATYPVLLSNGNEVEKKDLDGGRHMAVFEDPHVKPCYLFALVAGPLDHISDVFTTKSGKKVDLKVYGDPGENYKLHHAMASLIKSMKFDEDWFDLEYDLEVFNIVCVAAFNMGAMENKSLNIFNEALVVATPEIATDMNYYRIEGVVAHEYFHNWTGNRITCRDWFQLTLKEGLTVFRDGLFSQLVGLIGKSARIDQVKVLRSHQFNEDSGPLSHPCRPESYDKIDNFYTTTIYEKGSEINNMYLTMLGDDGFRKGMKKYVERCDGTAATCDDLLKAMEDGNGRDFTQFSKWFSTKGTPNVSVDKKFDGDNLVLTFKQGEKQVTEIMHIPISYGVIDKDSGEELVPTTVFEFIDKEASINIDLSGKSKNVVVSLLRNFSAPIKLHIERSMDDLCALAAFDTDLFSKWDAFQEISKAVIFEQYDKGSCLEQGPFLERAFEEALKTVLEGTTNDLYAVSLTLTLPDHATLNGEYVEGGKLVDPVLMSKARKAVKEQFGKKFEAQLRSAYEKTPIRNDITMEGIGARALRNCILGYLNDSSLAEVMYFEGKTMTEKMAAFEVLIEAGKEEKASEDFHKFAKDHSTVMDKWFLMRSCSTSDFGVIEMLFKHEDYSLKTPNRMRSLARGLLSNNELFHSEKGYDFICDLIKKVDIEVKNPQVASRLARSFSSLTQFSQKYQDMIKERCEKLLKVEELSVETREILSTYVK